MRMCVSVVSAHSKRIRAISACVCWVAFLSPALLSHIVSSEARSLSPLPLVVFQHYPFDAHVLAVIHKWNVHFYWLPTTLWFYGNQFILCRSVFIISMQLFLWPVLGQQCACVNFFQWCHVGRSHTLMSWHLCMHWPLQCKPKTRRYVSQTIAMALL